MACFEKICRYWKLKVKGYVHYDEATKNYLLGKIESLWNNKAYPMKYTFSVFLCQALGGRIMDEDLNCHFLGDAQNITQDKISFCRQYMREIYLDVNGLQNGTIFNEINEMVAGTPCYNHYSFVSANYGEYFSSFVWVFVLVLSFISIML